MKTLTLTVADDLYQQASQKATELDTSLRDVVQDLLVQWTTSSTTEPQVAADAQRSAEFQRFLDELNAKPRQPGPSVGPLNREELYQREQGAEQNDRVALQARLQFLFEEADARDRDKQGSGGPFSRKQLYCDCG